MRRRGLAVLAAGLLVLGTALSGCKLERRADLDQDGEGPIATTGGRLGSPVADSAIEVIETAEAALEGRSDTPLDSLLHPQATVFRQDEDDEGGSWQLLESRTEILGSLAFVFRRHRAVEGDVEGAETLSGTWILHREGERWRILHLHRSRGRTEP